MKDGWGMEGDNKDVIPPSPVVLEIQEKMYENVNCTTVNK